MLQRCPSRKWSKLSTGQFHQLRFMRSIQIGRSPLVAAWGHAPKHAIKRSKCLSAAQPVQFAWHFLQDSAGKAVVLSPVLFFGGGNLHTHTHTQTSTHIFRLRKQYIPAKLFSRSTFLSSKHLLTLKRGELFWGLKRKLWKEMPTSRLVFLSNADYWHNQQQKHPFMVMPYPGFWERLRRFGRHFVSSGFTTS